MRAWGQAPAELALERRPEQAVAARELAAAVALAAEQFIARTAKAR